MHSLSVIYIMKFPKIAKISGVFFKLEYEENLNYTSLFQTS